MKIGNNEFAHITVKELHDVLSAIGCFPSDKEEGLVPVMGFVIEADPALTPEENAKMQRIADRLTVVFDQGRNLDSAFHDIVDGMYC